MGGWREAASERGPAMTTPFFNLYTVRGALLLRARLATASAHGSRVGARAASEADGGPCDLARRADSFAVGDSCKRKWNWRIEL